MNKNHHKHSEFIVFVKSREDFLNGVCIHLSLMLFDVS